ncbi:MAG: hypothetical protein K2X28_01600 [Alphaproteobacteria bacterium]|nr:hypothetical protein [Alphaproteobacteria bacterium]
MKSNPACSIFGQGDGLLEEYYEFGKHQTGVALARTNTGTGTANLIDVGIESLKGRLMITCAHVIEGKEAESCSVRFMDENNESQEIGVQSLFFPSDYQNKEQDIGFILLKEPVDIGKFKPFKLNLARNNDSLAGKQVNVFGCSPLFGKASSHIVFREVTPLRRGMTTYIGSATNETPKMQSHFYDHRGLVKIYGMSKRDEPRELEIKEKIKELSELKAQSTDSKGGWDLSLRILGLHSELIRISPQQELLETIYYDDQFEEQLNQLQSTRGLDTSEVLNRWKMLTEDDKTVTTTFELGDSHIGLYKPLPRLSGQVFHGDSGGAWVHEGEIVALSTARHCDDDILTFTKELDLSQISSYFSGCEKVINEWKGLDVMLPFLKNGNSMSFATSIWSCRDWIQGTLEKIVAQN